MLLQVVNIVTTGILIFIQYTDYYTKIWEHP